MENCISSFIETIKSYIMENQLTATAFAGKLGMKDVCVARWLKGTNVPSAEYVIMVADYLNYSIDYLFGLVEDSAFVPTESQNSFAERINLLLGESKISKNRLAKICGVTSSNISKWLLHCQMPKPHILCLLAEYFNCSVDFLLARTSKR